MPTVEEEATGVFRSPSTDLVEARSGGHGQVAEDEANNSQGRGGEALAVASVSRRPNPAASGREAAAVSAIDSRKVVAATGSASRWADPLVIGRKAVANN